MKRIYREILSIGMAAAMIAAMSISSNRLNLPDSVAAAQSSGVTTIVNGPYWDAGRNLNYFQVHYINEGYDWAVNLYASGNTTDSAPVDYSFVSFTLPADFFLNTPPIECTYGSNCIQCLQNERNACRLIALTDAAVQGTGLLLGCIGCVFAVPTIILALVCGGLCVTTGPVLMKNIRLKYDQCVRDAPGRCSSQVGYPCK